MIRTKVVYTLVLSALLAAGAAFAAAVDPYAPIVSLTVQPPSGRAQELSIPESETRAIKLPNGTEYKFRANILDSKPWNQVVITIFKGPTAQQPDQVLGEVELKTGGPTVTSKTTPAFKLTVTKVTAPPSPVK